MDDLIWRSIHDCLPLNGETVLGWDRRRGYSISRRFDRKDLAIARFWIVNGQSGGIGTPFEIKPPDYWMKLPSPPVVDE